MDWSADCKTKAIDMWEAGASYDQIGAAISKSRGAVAGFLVRRGYRRKEPMSTEPALATLTQNLRRQMGMRLMFPQMKHGEWRVNDYRPGGILFKCNCGLNRALFPPEISAAGEFICQSCGRLLKCDGYESTDN